jgi:hypothetical protein
MTGAAAARAGTLPYDVRREVEDIEALIRHFGDRAYLHGISSGGALCVIAAAGGAPVDAVSVLEPPYRVDPDAPRIPEGYPRTLVELTPPAGVVTRSSTS